MDETQQLNIENPKQTVSHPNGWEDFKRHAHVVIKSFPKEYSVLNDGEELTILNISITPQGLAIARDQIIRLTPNKINNDIVATITNQYSRIESYSELERDKKSLDVFLILVNKSIKGTLFKPRVNAKSKKADPVQATIQLIILIVAIIAIIYGVRAFMD